RTERLLEHLRYPEPVGELVDEGHPTRREPQLRRRDEGAESVERAPDPRHDVARVVEVEVRNRDRVEPRPPLSRAQPREHAQAAASMKERNFDEGAALTTEGEGAVGFFVIEDGRAKVTIRGEERGQLGPGNYFVEIALITEGSRTATITAETPVKAWAMTMWD